MTPRKNPSSSSNSSGDSKNNNKMSPLLGCCGGSSRRSFTAVVGLCLCVMLGLSSFSAQQSLWTICSNMPVTAGGDFTNRNNEDAIGFHQHTSSSSSSSMLSSMFPNSWLPSNSTTTTNAGADVEGEHNNNNQQRNRKWPLPAPVLSSKDNYDDFPITHLIFDTTTSPPQLIKNTNNATTTTTTSLAAVVVGEAEATLSYRRLGYRFPIQRFENLSFTKKPLSQKQTYDHDDDTSPLVIGVLSGAGNKDRRDVIRATWGSHRQNIFFLVGGPWKTIEAEFVQYQDMFWIDDEEHYWRIAWKTISFFTAVHRLIGDYGAIFKTDDDTYLNVGLLEQLYRNHKTNQTGQGPRDYMGLCMGGMSAHLRTNQILEDTYPRYASGSGYQVSKDFVECMTQVLPRFTSITDEDANTGMLARACNVTCNAPPWPHRIFGFAFGKQLTLNPAKDFILQHYVKIPWSMHKYHAQTCSGPWADAKSCTGYQPPEPESLDPILCGGHTAKSCSLCAAKNGGRMNCNGACYWCDNGVARNEEGMILNMALNITTHPEMVQSDLKYHNSKESFGDDRCVLQRYQCSKEPTNRTKTNKKPEPIPKFVSCGGHFEVSCGMCAKGVGKLHCNGMCHWCPHGRDLRADFNAGNFSKQVIESDEKHPLKDSHCFLKRYPCRRLPQKM